MHFVNAWTKSKHICIFHNWTENLLAWAWLPNLGTVFDSGQVSLPNTSTFNLEGFFTANVPFRNTSKLPVAWDKCGLNVAWLVGTTKQCSLVLGDWLAFKNGVRDSDNLLFSSRCIDITIVIRSHTSISLFSASSNRRFYIFDSWKMATVKQVNVSHRHHWPRDLYPLWL